MPQQKNTYGVDVIDILRIEGEFQLVSNRVERLDKKTVKTVCIKKGIQIVV